MKKKVPQWMLLTGSGLVLFLLLLAGYIVFLRPLLQPPVVGGTPPETGTDPVVLVVQTRYPGEGSLLTAHELAEPIEGQLSGLPRLTRMVSQSRNDGTCTLFLTFDSGSDANMIMMEVNNRLAEVQSRLPDITQQHGIRTRNHTIQPSLLLAVSSLEKAADLKALSRYAEEQLSARLMQVQGVGNVVVLRGSVGEKPAALVAVYSLSGGDVAALVQSVQTEIDRNDPNRPEGIKVETIYDAAQPSGSVILVEIEFPSGTTKQRLQESLTQAVKTAARVEGVQRVATSSETLVSDRQGPWLLVTLAPEKTGDRSSKAAELQRQLNDAVIHGVCRICDPLGSTRGPLGRYPLEFAITGPDSEGVGSLGRALVGRLQKSDEVITIWSPVTTTPEPVFIFRINRAKAKELGIDIDELMKLIESTEAELILKDMNPLERAWKFGSELFGKGVDNFKGLKLRNNKGEWVPLRSLIEIRSESSPAIVERLNRQPMTRVHLNLAPDVTLEAGGQLCEKQFDEARRELGLSEEYKLVRLHDKP